MTINHEVYCMKCFALIPAGMETCPVCGYPVELASMLDYRQKLLHALDHPLDDVRMRAIIAIGLCRDISMSLPLVECALRHPLNIEEGLAVVEALKHFHDAPEGVQAMESLARDHDAHAVRQAASIAMNPSIPQTLKEESHVQH